MTLPEPNSPAAVMWLLMVTLDADGVRKKVEYETVRRCLDQVGVHAADRDPVHSPEVMMIHADRYYRYIEAKQADGDMDAVTRDALALVQDPEMRRRVLDMLVEVSLADSELHPRENVLLRRASVAWKLPLEV